MPGPVQSSIFVFSEVKRPHHHFTTENVKNIAKMNKIHSHEWQLQLLLYKTVQCNFNFTNKNNNN